MLNCDCYLRIEVLHSKAFIVDIYHGYSKRQRYVLLISSVNMSIGSVFANINTASWDTVLKPLIRLIALRRYTEASILLIVPKESASDHIERALLVLHT